MTDPGVLQTLRDSGVTIYDNSMISLFLRCPRAFYLRHQRGLVPADKTGDSLALLMGLYVHKALEEWYTNRDDTKAIKVFSELFGPHEGQPTISTKTGKELSATYTVLFGCSLLSAYFEKYRDDNRKIVTLETPLAEEISPEVYLAGRIDKIVQGPRCLVFVDYKTTKYINDFQINPNPQFMTYKHLTQQLTGEPVSGELDLLGVSKTKTTHELLRREPFDYSEWQMENWIQSTREHINNINRYIDRNIWPQTWKCTQYYKDCFYRPLCTLPSPDAYEKLIETKYVEDYWDPFQLD